jgi:RHH-type proline utilization regulon transcriptional repressor/proline dehydrogenase/delta 1-pyrroline-5-carboxylate dehydrogenase
MSSALVAPALIERAVELARTLQERAVELQTSAERRQQAELDRMLQSPRDKATLMQMTDEAFRSQTPRRTVDQFTHILDVQGIPRFFSPWERALLKGFQSFGAWLPGVAVPLVKERMRHETANVVLPGEHDLLTAHLRERIASGLRMNVNFLGEALLGEEEAKRRMDAYREALRLPEIEVLSVKISTIYSQISPLARAHTVATLVARLAPLIRDATAARFTRAEGTTVPKFIYLDMEEYRDMRLTAAAFMQVLDLPGMEQATAGIALQAYIPDSAQTQREINAWARGRIAAGGSPVTIRLVKGANMEMERVEASLRGWPQAPFKTKRETDANYKRMLIEAMQPENLAAVRVGVASHNLFDVAFGVILAEELQAGDRVQFEMLEGMANHQRRALCEQTRALLLYAPACKRSEFVNAIGYLIRRLDENTGPDNFLRHAFRLHVGSAEWAKLEDDFRAAFSLDVSDSPRRKQNRRDADDGLVSADANPAAFVNEPDSDFSLPANGEWAADLAAACANSARPRIAPRGEADVRVAIARAKADASNWRASPLEARDEVLRRVAGELRAARGELIKAAIIDSAKTVLEADLEVSEAIDFVEFYRRSAWEWCASLGRASRAKGIVVVVSPWNFPIAIPCGGIAAALATGNQVILKPSSDAAYVALKLCECFWRAGVPEDALQFFPAAGGGGGRSLVHAPEVDAVILTGGTETALAMLEQRPTLPLFAETGGKNATIVTALSDREQAIKHVLHSAFSHSGQKCSATSLLLLEGEVYDDPEFHRIFCDAVRSLPVGPAWDLRTKVGPLIRPPSGALQRGLTLLEPGETWAVEPRAQPGDPRLWSPGVKWNVQPGSFTHCTELFGPLLGVMRFDSLEEAIEIVNATGYGLTSGLESLDDREQATWRAQIRAGNLYINRPTTGAIVLRQPFGGMGKSVVGAGMKAGGPNYLAQFISVDEQTIHEERAFAEESPLGLLASATTGAADFPEAERLRNALMSYERWWDEEFSRMHDPSRLVGEDNFRRYLPMREVRVRVHAEDSAFELFARVAAARRSGARIIVSVPLEKAVRWVDRLERMTEPWAAAIEFIEEDDVSVAESVATMVDERLRYARSDRVPDVVRRAAARAGNYIADAPVNANGRVELLWYLREQSVSHAYHRYGNLGARAGEPRAEPL